MAVVEISEAHEAVAAAVAELVQVAAVTGVGLRQRVAQFVFEADAAAKDDPRTTILARWEAVNAIVERGRRVIDEETTYLEGNAAAVRGLAETTLGDLRNGDAAERMARAAILVPTLQAAMQTPEAVARILAKAWPDPLDRRVALDAIDNLILTVPTHLVGAIETVVEETKRELRSTLPAAELAIEEALERVGVVDQYVRDLRWLTGRELVRLETLLEHPASPPNQVPVDQLANVRNRRNREARDEIDSALLTATHVEFRVASFERQVSISAEG